MQLRPLDLSGARRRRLMLANNGGANLSDQLLSGAPFYSSLLYTAIPQRSNGETATFTRATTETSINNDGYLVTLLAGEIGFPGARRVRNVLQNASVPSEDFSAAAWAAGGVKTVTSNYAADPHGNMLADRVVIATGDYLRANTSLGTSANSKTWLASVYVKATSATQTFRILLTQNGIANNYSSDLVATSEWQRFSFSVPFTAGGSGFLCGIADKAAGGGTDLIVWGYQPEDVTAQTTQTAGEYVSVGVESAPYYHGSMVDGVKCFPTDLSGNPLTTMTGYTPWEARTNSLLHCRDLTNAAWVKVNATAAKDAIGIDGAASAASTLTATGAAATCLQTLVLAAAARSYSVNLKRKTGTGVVSICRDGATFTDVTGLINSTTWTRVKIENTSVLNPVCGIKLATSGDAVYVDYNQDEAGAFITPSIATTTIAVARNADVLTYLSTGLDGTQGWAYAEIAWNATGSSAGIVDFDSSGNRGWFVTTTGATALEIYDGTTELKSPTVPVSQAAPTKVAMTFGGSTMNCSYAGTNGTPAAFDGNMNLGVSFSVGKRGTAGGNQALNGSIRNLRIGTRKLSDSELRAITS